MPTADPAGWTTAAQIANKLRRRWASGELLRAHGSGEAFDPVDIPLRGPRAGEIAGDLARVQTWVEALDRAAPGRFTIVRKPVGGRVVGRNELPDRAVVSSEAQAWRLLGVEGEVVAYDAVLSLVGDDGAVRQWVLAHPHAALAVDDWPGVLAARAWLAAHRGSGRFLREITADGVDTKFVERHRATLAGVLGIPAGPTSFLAALGLRDRPPRLRMRFDDEFAGMPHGLTEGTFLLGELARVRVSVQSAVVVENEITFLSAPVPTEGVLIWGEGFRVNRPGSLPWLRDAAVHYWGDLDTHGFAILDRLRAWLPQTESFLMDAHTLLAHRDRWVTEPSPTRAALTRLRPGEHAMFSDLVTDRYAERVRLEQERIDWTWVLDRWPVE